MSPKFLCSAAALLCALPSIASAQVTDQTDEDVIIVRGNHLYSDQINALKTPTPIIDVPQSLSITTADQILAQGFDSIGDIVLYTPGLNQSQGEGHRDTVVLRGVRSTADFFIDGIRDDVQYYRSLYNLEQVEVLRGPNALLFGRGGTGGLINRVTKKAVATVSGSIRLFAGSQQRQLRLIYLMNMQIMSASLIGVFHLRHLMEQPVPPAA